MALDGLVEVLHHAARGAPKGAVPHESACPWLRLEVLAEGGGGGRSREISAGGAPASRRSRMCSMSSRARVNHDWAGSRPLRRVEVPD